jgi:hypothetical protein
MGWWCGSRFNTLSREKRCEFSESTRYLLITCLKQWQMELGIVRYSLLDTEVHVLLKQEHSSLSTIVVCLEQIQTTTRPHILLQYRRTTHCG